MTEQERRALFFKVTGQVYALTSMGIYNAFCKGLEAGYEAGRKDENEYCAKVCDEQEQRSRESSEKSKRERDRFMYHHCSVTAKWNAAAIRARREQ